MRRILALMAVLSLAACGRGGNSPAAPPAPPPLPSRAVLTITFTPDPVVATPSGNAQLPFRATYTITIRESAGLGGNVNFLNEALFNPVTNLQSGTRNIGADQVIALVGTNHIAARGTLTIPRDFSYSPGGNQGTGRAVNVNTVVQVTDDAGNLINVDAVIRIL